MDPQTVFEGFMTVEPEGSSTVEIKYTLPLNIRSGDDYSLYIQKQPGTGGNMYIYKEGGKVKKKFILSIDTQLP
jgi:hypothetical protein